MKQSTVIGLKRTLRIISIIFIVFCLFMFIGYQLEPENPEHAITTYEIIQLSLFGIGLLGLVVALKWEFVGGIIATGSYVILAIVNPVVLIPTLLYIWPGISILFIFIALDERKRK